MATITTVRLIIARIQLTIKNMSVEQVLLKASLSLPLNSVNMSNLMIRIEKTLEIIEQVHKVHQVPQVPQAQLVHKESKAFKVPLVLMAHKVHLDKRVQVY